MIYNNFEKVLREARNKVTGICGCAEETSCYGCLRNYSNQYFHDEISRGLASRYIDWLLNGETDQNDSGKMQSEDLFNNDEITESEIMISDVPDTSSNPDTLTQLEMLRDSADDDSIKTGLEKLVAVARYGWFENPVTEEKLLVGEEEIWPEIFWGKSRVALFMPGAEKQYEILKKHNWHCYIIDENIDAEQVMNQICF